MTDDGEQFRETLMVSNNIFSIAVTEDDDCT